jgi:hypothetical protein
VHSHHLNASQLADVSLSLQGSDFESPTRDNGRTFKRGFPNPVMEKEDD